MSALVDSFMICSLKLKSSANFHMSKKSVAYYLYGFSNEDVLFCVQINAARN